MQILKSLLTLLALAATTMVSAQPGTWDREKYPDLPSPTPTNINMKTYRAMAARIQRQKEQGIRRPDHVNNALNPSFPPIINQSGGSCGAASSIYYQFTNQINTSRFTAADSDDRRYATHFPWLLNANGPEGTGYERLGHNVGIASCTDYGGTTYSHIFGNSGQSDADDDCGWMQGYERWFNTMHNRILRENSFPYNCGTEEGRELVKNYLWNRCGDDSYASGGICGIGVAAGPFEGNIPKTEANDAAGVTGMKYVTDWNETYNHAMTIVGYDDRLEFDLDGNGVIGETSNSKGENEVGAWIICNSWGDGYANKGFIYCPYEKSNSVKGWPKENSFTPGYFDVMRNYRPLRTLRINMEYSHRSEVALFAGVAQDLEAAEPEKSLRMTHFEYCGDGNRSKTQPAPAIPMLGRWADGELHYEPMEFGYDLTELTQDFDLSRPLKYFFWIETQPWGEGKGKLHEVTLIDYVIDRQGTETPLLVGEPLQIRSAGKKTMVSGIAYAQYVPEPRNPNFQADLLAWEKPAGTSYPLKGYNIYKDEELFTSVDATTLQVSCPEMGCYTVRALYAVDGNDLESKATKAVAPPVEVLQTPVNKVLNMSFGSQLTIPNVCRQSMKNFTLEFWMGALVFRSPDSFGVKAMNGESTASFFFKVNSDKKIEVGHDGGDRVTSKSVLKPRASYHIAIVSEGLVTKVYVNGEQWINWTSGYNHAGIDKACDLIFGMTEGTTTNYKEFYTADWYGWVDEIRFWDYSRTQEEIQEMYDDMIANPHTYPGLTHCYQMTTRTDSEGNVYLIDGKGQHDALVNNPDKIEVQEKTLGEDYSFLRPEPRADFSAEGKAVQGIPVRVTDLCSPSVVHRTWTATGASPSQLTDVNAPQFVFSEPGTQTITLKAQSLFGAEATKSVEVEVLPAALPEVDFSVPEGDIAAGQHITFLNTSSPMEMATYEWEIEGAEIPVVKTINGAATFLATGTYDVTLTATNNLGSVSKTKQVSVVGVKPQAAFSISNNVALVGEPFTLIDESRYAPQQWTWEIASGVEIYKVKGQHKAVKLDVPGHYDVTLTAENDKGSNSLTRRQAITICNADGRNGLRLDGTDDLVETASPFGETTRSVFSMDWWMFPGRLSDVGCHMGDKASTFQLSVTPTGAINIDMDGKSVKSEDYVVLFDEWHHYAITFRTGTFTFYRDTENMGTSRVTGVSRVPVMERFALGGTERPFKAVVDELRVWNYMIQQKDLLQIANAPLENPADNEALLLYYDFNQSTGDVVDRSSQGLTGKRINFGPDGDAWENTRGIFCINPKGSFSDVTGDYMKNYKHPFKYNGTVNPSNSSRYLKLMVNSITSPWVHVNDVKNGNIITQWHVDAEKNHYLTLETTWSGFAEAVNDLMLYQTVVLPPGIYEFWADRDGDTNGYNWQTDDTYVVVGEGDILPVTEKLETDALAWASIEDKVSFQLDDSTKVSLGLLSNMHGQLCVAIGAFKLYQKRIINYEGENIDPVGVQDVVLTAEPTLQAVGGMGNITIEVSKPQEVVVSDLSGHVIFREWLDARHRIPARRGIYVVNKQKVLVR